MRYLLLLLGTFLLSSCIYIASTKTSYNHNITDEAKKRIVFVGQNDSFRLTTNDNSNGSFHKPTKQLYLVSGKQMKATLARRTWQIVYVCLPYCKASACVSYKTFCDSARNRGVQPWVVLRDIWCDSIVNSVEKYPLVGMDYKYYKKALCSKLFFRDMVDETQDWKKLYNGHHLFFLFNGSTLVASGDEFHSLLEFQSLLERVQRQVLLNNLGTPRNI